MWPCDYTRGGIKVNWGREWFWKITHRSSSRLRENGLTYILWRKKRLAYTAHRWGHFKELILPWTDREVERGISPLGRGRKFDDAEESFESGTVIGRVILYFAVSVRVYKVKVSKAARSGFLFVSFPSFRLGGESRGKGGNNDWAHFGSSDRSEVAGKQLMGGFQQLALESCEDKMELTMIDNELWIRIAKSGRNLYNVFSTRPDWIRDYLFSDSGHR
jgi:hypothetical protein